MNRIGDLADFYSVSSHSKNPLRVRQLSEEVAAVNAALTELDKLGASDKVFIAGNHCDRLQRYLQDRAPELFETVNLEELFMFDDRGWEYVPYKEYTRRGALFLTHDCGSAGRYAVYRCLEMFNHSVVTGHTHRMAYIVEGDATGKARVSASFGWLGDVNQVDYMQKASARKNWALGFGVGYLNTETGVTYLAPVPIVNYSCVVEGKLYTG